ncbi:MAG: methyltransferase domain-containing protein, partial [Bdellovibrionia bacterium]
MRRLDVVFREIFSILELSDYQWTPAKPERLLEYRKTAEAFPPLQRFFGLGIEITSQELIHEGFSPELAQEALDLYPAISRNEHVFIPHAHWPAKPGMDYVYLGEESYELLRLIGERTDGLERLKEANVLDLGSGSGALLLYIGSSIAKGLGIDISRKAVEWSQAAARAQGLDRLSFHAAAIGSPEAEVFAHGTKWDFAILNPPFAIPTETEARPHRDGGALGIELPLLFLQYAARNLGAGGEVFTLATNPIVQGRSAFFDRLDRGAFKIAEKKCLHDQFNHSLYRKERYAERG